MKGFSIRRILNNKDFTFALSLFVIIGFISYSFFELSKVEVTVVQADERTDIRTHANVVGDVLDELSITVSEHDDISHSLDTQLVNNMEIEHTIAKEVIVTIGEEEQQFFTTSATVEEFLAEQGIEVTENDNLSVALDTPIDDQLALTIDKAFQVAIHDQDAQEDVWVTPGSTVEELLAANEIELSKLDRVQPEQDTVVEQNEAIHIVRVEKVTDVIKEKQEAKVVKRNDDSLEKGTEEVVSEGKPGTIEKHYEVVLENGEEVSRKLIKEEVTQDSEDRILAIGTKEEEPEPELADEPEVTVAQEQEPAKEETKQAPKEEKSPAPEPETVTTAAADTSESAEAEPVSRGEEPKEEGKTLYMQATAYNWDCSSCDGRGLTATGYDLKANPNGVIAVDPSVIPLGTKVWVEGYGYAIARDTGGNIKGNKIDLHMPSSEQAVNYGVQNVQVKIID